LENYYNNNVRYDDMSDDTSKLKRPIGVTILAIIFIISGAISIGNILGYGFEMPLFLVDWSEMSIEEGGFAIYAVVGGMIVIAVGVAMFSGKHWAWPAIIIMVIVSIAGSIIFPFGDDYRVGLFEIIFYVIVLLYMRKSNVKAYFGRIK